MLVRRFQNSNHMKAEAAVFAKGQRFLSRMPGGMSVSGTERPIQDDERLKQLHIGDVHARDQNRVSEPQFFCAAAC